MEARGISEFEARILLDGIDIGRVDALDQVETAGLQVGKPTVESGIGRNTIWSK